LMTHAFFGYAIFGHVPDRYTLIGAAVVIASGLYILHRERVKNRAKLAAVAAGPR
ncbi:MAG: EamA/RhaT family transporter, partial [Hyphomicrobiaceae bacterium]|nr:EamA/RhaT family transporter [Hyphomicrobiaceae bacterium]